MKSKTFTLTVLSIFSVIAMLAIASAGIGFNQTSITSTIPEGQTSVTVYFKLNNTGATNYSSITWSGKTSIGNWSLLPNQQILNTSENISLSATLSLIPSTYSGLIIANITANVSDDSATLPISVNVTASAAPVTCDEGNAHDNLRIKKIEFANNGFSGNEFGKDDEWFPIDEIEAEITIENNGQEKIEDIELEWGLYDPSSDDWVIEMDDEDDFDLKDDDTEVITVTFTLDDVDMDLEDLSEGTYVFYVKAKGYDNEYEEDICVVDSEEAEIIIESDFVVVSEIEIPEENECGTEVPVSARIWNIGEDDQEDVVVNIYNKELKIDMDLEAIDVDAFSYENLNILIEIPENVASKYYELIFTVYDEDGDVYENDYDDDESIFSVPLKITCEESSSDEDLKTVVSASLVSGGNAGEELVVESTITNLDTKDATYMASVSGYSEWADSAEVEPSAFSIKAGESKKVTITLNVNKDAEGEQLFYIELYSGNNSIPKQPVSVSIEKKGFFSSLMDSEINYMWLIILINIILIIAIIIVAVRIFSK